MVQPSTAEKTLKVFGDSMTVFKGAEVKDSTAVVERKRPLRFGLAGIRGKNLKGLW